MRPPSASNRHREERLIGNREERRFIPLRHCEERRRERRSNLALSNLLSSLATMHWLAAAFLALLGALFTAAPAAAADPVVVAMDVHLPDRLTVGDRVTYVVTLEADRGTEVSLVQSSLPAVVEVVDSPSLTSEDIAGGRVRLTLAFRLAPFAPGDIDVPPMTLRYFGQGIAGGELQTPASRLSVTSVLPEGEAVPPPRDLKPQAAIGAPEPGWVLPALAGAVATLVIVALLIYLRLRILGHRGGGVPAPVLDQELPEDRARGVLDNAGAGFSLGGDYVEYYSSIGLTVRRYLSERYGFPAFALTTRELEAEMLRRGLDRWQVRVASGLLEQCDSVVYAHYRPAAERADADLTAAYEIVEMSRPQPLPQEAST